MKLPIASITLASLLPHVAAVLTAVVFLQSLKVLAAEPVIFWPAYAPAPADNPLKGFVRYAGQGRKFPHSEWFASKAAQAEVMDAYEAAFKILPGIPNPLKGGKSFHFANEDAEPLRPGWLTLGMIVIP